MELSIFHDGQFFIGIVEYKVGSKSKFVKYTFGAEPDDREILFFIDKYLLRLIENTKTSIITKSQKRRVNPKRRLQRQVAKEQKSPKDLTKAQLALKEEQKLKKNQSKKRKKEKRDAFKQRKRGIKKYKAKEKHKGH